MPRIFIFKHYDREAFFNLIDFFDFSKKDI